MPAVTTHASPYSGQWYPADAGSLEKLIQTSIETSARRIGAALPPRPIGLVVPHAGIVYSGTVAAAAYRHFLASPPARVFLMGFPHHGYAPGIWLPDVGAFETPLGAVRVDADAVARLVSSGEFQMAAEDRLCDHSLEIQLPFLSRCAPSALLVPIYVSRAGPELRRAAARRLAGIARPGDVYVASSDFTHYGRSFGFLPFPVDSRTGDQLRSLDAHVIEGASSLEDEMFLSALEESQATVCGREPIALLLATLAELEGEDEIFQERLDYQTSGELTGDYRHSVSYAALGYFRHSSMALNAEERSLLLESARRTLENYQRTGRRDPLAPARTTPALERRAGVFVSLHKGGELRGCVGRTQAEQSIAQSVPEMTLAAATEDTRFDRVSSTETGIEIEISILSPLKRVPSEDRIVAGTHGVFVDTGRRRGLLLPQVAAERGWDTRRFLGALAAKIGVHPEVFHAPETRLFRFRAQVFH